MTSRVQNWNDPADVADWIATRDQGGNPGRQEQLALVLTLLGQLPGPGLRVLDLGCGDGLVAELILTRLAGSYVAGIDLSPPMLDAATTRLAPYPGRYALYQRALEDDRPLAEEPPFDAAIGVQSIHHLPAAGKQGLFRWVHAHLRPGGLFLISDRVRLPAAGLFSYFAALYSRQQTARGGRPLPADYGYAAHLRALAVRGDQPDTVEDQLAWLRSAGFGDADCFYRVVERAVFGGLKGPASPPDTAAADDASAALIDADPDGAGLF